MVMKALSLGEKGLGHETHHSPPLRVKDKNECSYTSTLQYAFTACTVMLLFTQKCGKLYSTFELICFPNMYLVVSNTSFLDVHLLLTKMPKLHAIR
jgi:hypothetical protein